MAELQNPQNFPGRDTSAKDSLQGKTVSSRVLLITTFRLVAGVLFILALLFLPAGTWNYWQAWVWFASLFIPMIFSFLLLVRTDPTLLERRTRTKETRPQQKWIIALSIVYFFIIFILPGFDRRYHWSSVPVWLVILADLFVIGAYSLYILVLRTNTYASRIIEVEKDQPVISSGPYALVRHPMYLSMILMMTATPLALGSWWAFIPSLALIPLLAARARNEEALLLKDLPGYQEYIGKTRYRLFPGIW